MQVVIRLLAIRMDPVPRRFRVFARAISMQTERGEKKKKRRNSIAVARIWNL